MAGLGRSFGYLWGSTGLSNLADGFVKVGAPLLAVSLTRSPTLVSLVAAAGTLPWLALALHAGALADRADRRRVMVAANVARAGVLAVAALLAVSGLMNLWVLVAAVLLAGACEVFADLTAQSVLPMTVAATDLTRANSRVSAAQLIGNDFLGAPVTGLLVAILPAAVLGAPALLYGAAALLLLGMRGAYRPAAPADGRRPPRQEIAEALRYLWGHRVLRGLAITAGLLNLANAAYFAVFVLWAVGDGSRVGLTPGQYGLMMTAFAAGAVLGSLLSERAAALFGETRTLLGSWLTVSLLLLVPVAVPSPVALYPTAVLWGLLGAGANVLVISTRQRLIPAALLGRVNSAYRLLGMGGMPVGALLGGVVAEAAGIATVLVGATALCLAAIPVAWRALFDQISGRLTSEPAFSDISRTR
ncbi:Predicted arabinose efflux permease, MFS family [Nonomuraea maritima]|uniref:Predicted arabinose efflux permease, MFS family n=1 Tax=Nonomuraea maritima TaxID=683260 RepID=A0A1G9HNG1_9ACTN|nr:MFS transporter [Nonomuraea maritima]SDL14422.1 Predicted arabinose efflux permease, MFS family [Nonomuraea maritima]